MYKTDSFGTFEVVAIKPKGRYTVRFCNGYTRDVAHKEVTTGRVKNPTYLSIYGVACLGIGEHTATKLVSGRKVNTSAYEVWNGIIKRCYNPMAVSYSRYGGIGVTVSVSWRNFQTFADWFYSHTFSEEIPLWEVDKDLTNTAVKEYSCEFCNLVPNTVNALFSGTRVLKGVTFNKQKGKWVAQLQRGELTTKGSPKQSYLGQYTSEQEAIEAYTIAKIEHCAKVAEANKDYIPQVIFNNLTCEDYVRAVLLEKRNLL